jgi:PH domain
MISKLKKIQKITNKKVQLLLTDKPKLICVDPSKIQAKCNIIWSDDPNSLSVQCTSPSHFKICTVNSCCLFTVNYADASFMSPKHSDLCKILVVIFKPQWRKTPS